ncbi:MULTISPECIES: hypothetical protein [Comamonadaceae]|uniref:Uncharacterized protein n=1 Tax=Simplicispira suum TaxID=2109915 RepID=A0A2S0N5U8_9BURK|nr:MULTISPECIES: hypothetical protein [Comamonadaceae]ADV02202.1 hypothetical protein Alide_4600 [Alicycliphilus denitrificans BC]AVO43407.1 hypothetical protein C6571_18385 [Simplicispira suum]
MKPCSPAAHIGRAVAGDDSPSNSGPTARSSQGGREGGRGPVRYDAAAIAKELEVTASGKRHFGNALRVAKDMAEVDSEERALLDRWATARQSAADNDALRELARKLRALE